MTTLDDTTQFNDATGHTGRDNQFDSADSVTLNDVGGHLNPDHHLKNAAYAGVIDLTEEGGHTLAATHFACASDLNLICGDLRELHLRRQDLHRAEKSNTLRIKAICRRLCSGQYRELFDEDRAAALRLTKADADKLYKAMFGKSEHPLAIQALIVAQPFIESRTGINGHRTAIEKQMATEAMKLPVSEWILNTRGIGIASLAAIIGETGNLSNYATVSRVWKRVGLAVIGGERQRKKSGLEDAKAHGYNPSRRSVMWTIGDSMFRSGGHYADLCREYKVLEVAKAEAKGLTVVPAAKIKKGQEHKHMSKGHVHNRSTRKMTKTFLKDFVIQWWALHGKVGQ